MVCAQEAYLKETVHDLSSDVLLVCGKESRIEKVVRASSNVMLCMQVLF